MYAANYNNIAHNFGYHAADNNLCVFNLQKQLQGWFVSPTYQPLGAVTRNTEVGEDAMSEGGGIKREGGRRMS